MRLDTYLIDTLMRDLVAHSHSPSAFLVYLLLYRRTHAEGVPSIAVSHSMLAESTGISKRSVQVAIQHLVERRLIRQRKAKITSVPVYTVLTPWVRKA
jgi:transcription initiation factor IIE alpha subunit